MGSGHPLGTITSQMPLIRSEANIARRLARIHVAWNFSYLLGLSYCLEACLCAVVDTSYGVVLPCQSPSSHSPRPMAHKNIQTATICSQPNSRTKHVE